MMPSNDQIKAILELIKHKIDVSSNSERISINIKLLEDYQDYESIIDKLDYQLNAISVSQYPNEGKLNEADLDLVEMEYSSKDVSDYMSYIFSIQPKFSDIYREYIDLNPKGIRTISTSEIKLTIASYCKHTGVLNLGPYHEVEIAQRGKTKTTKDIHTEQCKLMEKLFKDEKSLENGIPMQYLFKVISSKKLSDKEIKKVKNLLTEINDKFTGKTNLKRLVITKNNKIQVNPIYLL